MRRFTPRRAVCLALFALGALGPGACRPTPQGTLEVVVIGDKPKLRDPALGALAPPDAVLVDNVAQGLVQFDAGGNIVAGLAERWNVSDDGLSYIFRLATTDWPNGRKVTAQQVARILKRSISSTSSNPLKDTLGAVEDIVAMTDRVVEVRLHAPRPNLLALLAQPEFAIVRNGMGSGPYKLAPEPGPGGQLRLVREVLAPDEEVARREEVLLDGVAAQAAISSFAAAKADLVLGGTFTDLPYAKRVKLPRNSLRFDPAMGLFGLVPVRSGDALDEPDVRRLLSQSIDRDSLIDALNVPGLTARATVLEPALEGVPDPQPVAWAATPLAQQRPTLIAEARRIFGATARPTLRLLLPQGPGADLLLSRLTADWGALGIKVERAANRGSADLELIDAVAPSTSPAWFLRRFRCEYARVCDAEADTLLDSARNSLVPAQRAALLVQAAARIDDAQLFLPIMAPVRWSLVSNRIQGFAGNRYARHTLTGLQERVAGGS
jgi:peptide/nickel transport system substrate-binding protein